MIKATLYSLLAGIAIATMPAPPPPPPPPLEIAVEDAAALWSRPDGTGFANDVVRAAFKASGVDVNFRVVPYARCKRMLVDGAVVACFSMSMHPDLTASVVFPAMPIFTCYTDLVQNPVHPLSAAHLRDLPRGTAVGSVLGYEYPEPILKAVKDGAIVLDESQSEESLLRKLAAGRIAAALVNVNESKSLAYLNAIARTPSAAVRVERIGVLQSYLGFSKRHANAKSAMQKYEEGMRRIASNGVLSGLARQWGDSAAAGIRAAQSSTGRQKE
jgi:ABC-type amino acid transport substrate-binding protein